MAENKIKGFKVNGVEYGFDIEIPIPEVGKITAPNGTEYTLKVNNQGDLYTENENDPNKPAPLTPPTEAKLAVEKLYINEIYCGGDNGNEHTLNYCSHNFVELGNVSNKDINLEGMTLQYTANGTDWKVLPLKGVIKAGSTFLIRGAKCAVEDSPLCKIHVNTYDMEWYNGDNLITFNNAESAKFYLTLNTAAYGGVSPYDTTASKVAADAVGYINLVGLQGTAAPDGCEAKPCTGLKNSALFKRYYHMDGGAKAIKAIGKRSNATEMNYVNLTKENGELIPNIEIYTPHASWEGKNLFTDKTRLSSERPSMITCSFGIQATDNGSGATRCFNWVSKNTADKYLWIRTKGSNVWNIANGVKAFSEGDGRTEFTNSIYNTITKEYSDHGVFIANKYIKSGIPAGEYEYTAGRKNADGTPNLEHCLDIRRFVVRANEDVNGNIGFIQTSDQQGFVWDEYQMWKAAANTAIYESGDTIQFMINTGDMTQDGNRMNEWLDYFDGKGELNNVEEMATIGNNDLSHRNLYEYSNADDNDKVWLENITFFYTFEMDEENPSIFKGYDDVDYYIPSLYSFNYGNVHFMCVNSEIKAIAESDTSHIAYDFGDGHTGIFYPQIKQWCENDVAKNTGFTWTVAYCHEMPFTILTADVTEKEGGISGTRPGSSINTNIADENKYWFSEFCQTHNIPLVLGGHKHTQATSRGLLENIKYEGNVRTIDSWHPIIVVNSDILEHDYEATGLTEYNGYKYPNTWFDAAGNVVTKYAIAVNLCTFEMEDNIPTGATPVVYAMSQATGYKHTSNKELPGKNIPWLKYYFEQDGTTASPAANAGQMFPFYTIWQIKNDKIIGNVRKVYGGFNNKGKFDINTQGANLLKGISNMPHEEWMDEEGIGNRIFSVNGTTITTKIKTAYDDTTIIEIKK